jgi:uncharacterized membrane protein YidH (DUF202 family)
MTLSEDQKPDSTQIIINEAQLVLAEKRTALATIRTGIAVLALPLSISSVLIATSTLYNVEHVLYLLIPVSLINGLLVVLGIYLIMRSLIRLRHYEKMISHLKRRHSVVAEFID